MRDVVSTSEKLRPIAEATGGTARRIAAGSTGAIAMPRVVGLNPSPSYGGGDYIGIKRTGSSELIGARSTSLASGFFGLAVLLGMVTLRLGEGKRRLEPQPRRGLADRRPRAAAADRFNSPLGALIKPAWTVANKFGRLDLR